MRRKIRWFIHFFLILLAVCMVLFVQFRSQYRDIICALAETQVKNSTSDLTNDAIAKQIADGVIQYDRIVFFEKDLDGRITALKTNMSEVNRLKTDILNIINDEILALDTSDLGIPLGSFFLPELFPGNSRTYPVHPKLRCGIFQQFLPGRYQSDPAPADYDRQCGCGHPGAGSDRQFYHQQRGGCCGNRHCWCCTQHIFTNRREL